MFLHKNVYTKNNINIQNHPSVLIFSAIHHEIFPVGALEAQSVGRVLQDTRLENLVMYG